MQTESLAPNAILPEHEQTAGTFHIFMQLKTTRHWLNLQVHERLAFLRESIFPILKRRPQVTVRYFETEAFNASTSEILIWETTDLNAWAWVADHLRDTPFWDHYFEVVSLMPAIEANYMTMLEAA